MSATPYSQTRQPVMPSGGGLMGRSFTYRSAEKTDVRLTWQHAQKHVSSCSSTGLVNPSTESSTAA
jgi:hypothetical protein